MFVLELYFIFYRVPKMMTRLARERNRSALRWSLLGMGAWIGAEFVVVFSGGLIYSFGIAFADWPTPMAPGYKLGAYIFSLVAALGSTTIISRILMRKPIEQRLPPPPPSFQQTE